MPEIRTRLSGLRSGYPYDTTSAKGVAQYAVDAFLASCDIGGAYRPQDVYTVTADEIIESFVPGFILEDERYGVLRRPLERAIGSELERLCRERSCIGGAAVELHDFDGGPVDEILLEKALDFMIRLEKAERLRSAEDYELVHARHEGTIQQCARIIRAFGEQLEPQTFHALQAAFRSLVDSGKYARNSIVQTVARSVINEAWDGLCGWEP